MLKVLEVELENKTDWYSTEITISSKILKLDKFAATSAQISQAE